MATSHLSHPLLLPVPAVAPPLRRPIAAAKPTGPPLSLRRHQPLLLLRGFRSSSQRSKSSSKWAVRLSLVEGQLKSTVDVKRLVGFLYEDLPHLFDDQGIDRTAYDDGVVFKDPITKHDSIGGYLFNIELLKKLFRPDFYLHWVKQTGPYEITTRWTMVMRFILLPWRPELVFTGISVMGINPDNGKFCSHVDYWDSIKNNDYFSVEGLLDVFKQLRMYKTPDLETPKYQILKRASDYEVRRYSPFVVVETQGDKLSGSTGFNAVAGYIFGKNSGNEKIAMTTPVFTETTDTVKSKVAIRIVLPQDKDLASLPEPNQEEVSIRKVEGGIAAAVKFSGKPSEEVVQEKEKALRISLVRDGLRPSQGCLLARYNDPGRTWDFVMIWYMIPLIYTSHVSIFSGNEVDYNEISPILREVMYTLLKSYVLAAASPKEKNKFYE